MNFHIANSRDSHPDTSGRVTIEMLELDFHLKGDVRFGPFYGSPHVF